MSIPRLTFLYPQLFRPLLTQEIPNISRPIACPSSTIWTRQFHKSNKRRQETYAQRYGPAAEPGPPPQIPQDSQLRQLPVPLPADVASPANRDGAKSKPEQLADISSKPTKNASSTAGPALSEPEVKDSRQAVLDANEAHPKEIVNGTSQEASSKPLETVLHIEAPSSAKRKENHLPHLHAPPYVHHFDTYTLVKDLEKGNFTQAQSITLMKAVRGLLAVNLDVAKEGLVSKSDIENETYLFRAACSELRTEIQNTRKSSSEKMRTERAHLQHECDILNQKLTQDSLTLKDDLKGMFNDRKMAVRMEQRAMESAIQELNYKITVALNSDSRGYVEGLRWVLTRRAAMAIAAMAFLILGSLRYSSYMIHLQNEERKKIAASTTTSANSREGNYTTPSRSTATQTGETGGLMASMDSGSNPSYVSLG